MKQLPLYISFLMLIGAVESLKAHINPKGYLENKGQIRNQDGFENPDVLFLLPCAEMNVQLRSNGFSYDILQAHYSAKTETEAPSNKCESISVHRVDVSFVGCNREVQVVKGEPGDTYYNYFTGHGNTLMNVKTYDHIFYENVYNGIDIDFFTDSSGAFKYNFVVHPYGNINDIQLRYDGCGSRLNGNMIQLETEFGILEERVPASYLRNSYTNVAITYVQRAAQTYGFESVQSTQGNSDLIIDPAPCLSWCSYLGGTGEDYGTSIDVDGSGNVYVFGTTLSTSNIATTGAHQTTIGGQRDAFVAKFDPSGSNMFWATYYGGSASDYAGLGGLTVDGIGNVFITGSTYSLSGISTPGSYQNYYADSCDAFIAALDATGNVRWGTYFGGMRNDITTGIALDQSDNIYIIGSTESDSGITTPNSFKSAKTVGYNAFVAKFDSTGAIIWSTYYGDTATYAGPIEVDKFGNIFISGMTIDTGLATAGALQNFYGGGYDVFIAKLNAAGTVLLSGTYYGGGGDEGAYGMDISDNGEVYLTGWTNDLYGISTPGAHQTNYSGAGTEAFVAKFSSQLDSLIWGTYYGGYSDDLGYEVDVSSNGDNVYVGGSTNSFNNISTVGSLQVSYGGGAHDAFVALFNSSGVRSWGTYYGGSGSEYLYGMCVDSNSNVYFTGWSSSTSGIATSGTYQSTFGGYYDVMVTVLGCTETGIDTLGQSAAMNVFPNPSNGTVKVTGLDAGRDYTIDLYNSSGAIVLSKQVSNCSTTDISTEGEGLYLLVVSTGNDVMFTKKLIFTHE